MSALEVEIKHRYAGERGFSIDVRFEAPHGVTVLFGPSGAGKTSILEIIAGVLPVDATKLTLEGTELSTVPPQKRRVGYLFQTLALFPHMTVLDNVEYGLHDFPRQQRRALAMDMLERFRIADLAKQRPGRISGGERQRTALARTLVTKPRILLLDEPLSALDLAIKREIIADLREWIAEERVPVIYVTHILHEAFSLAEQVMVLRDGRIVRQGSAKETLSEERKFLLGLLSEPGRTGQS